MLAVNRPRKHYSTVTTGPIFASVFGPMPFTRSSSSTDRNGPCSSRYSTIRAASAGPTSGSSSSSAALALLMFSVRAPIGAAPAPPISPGARPGAGRIGRADEYDATIPAMLAAPRSPTAAHLAGPATDDARDGSGMGGESNGESACRQAHPRCINVSGLLPSLTSCLIWASRWSAAFGAPVACIRPAHGISGLNGIPFRTGPSDNSCQQTLCTYGLEQHTVIAWSIQSACDCSLHGARQYPGSYGSSASAPARGR